MAAAAFARRCRSSVTISKRRVAVVSAAVGALASAGALTAVAFGGGPGPSRPVQVTAETVAGLPAGEVVIVPNVVGDTYGRAQDTLPRIGLRVVTNDCHTSAVITQQRPAFGAVLQPNGVLVADCSKAV